MDKILSKLRHAVARGQSGGPAIRDVRTSSVRFKSYRWVLFIVALAAVYYALIASDRYVTEARIYVKSSNASSSVMPQLQMLTGAQGDSQDAVMINAFFQSRDLMELMEKEVSFSDHFSHSGADFLSRLKDGANAEDRLEYFKKRLSASVSPDSGLIVVRGQGFTPEFSHKFVEAVIRAGEAFINSTGQKIATEEIAFVEKELNRSRDALARARDKLLSFQNDNGLLNAEATGASMQKVVSEMEAELVRLHTEEKALSSYLNSGAAELVTLRSRIEAIENQLKQERQKLASTDETSINEVNATYQELEMELKFATDLYQTSLVALEKARVESYHKLKHVVVVQSPAIPDSAEYPRKLYDLITLFVTLSLAYGVVMMIFATIREHRDV
ncbi:Wzz/FepE/Etk N-terminal domain-containing protein [Kordiimonas pumila]|uniref:Wzz/FepE/Etk N-terminal domain-containing protein n=1 Tax=Kordiimonas pumila TaxID=2161677 RepID=A0ABV7D3E7_9PROT|nr:Wzz/FepE/Etk N-terminal domain-containing protein [Kordiimonas pumila]